MAQADTLPDFIGDPVDELLYAFFTRRAAAAFALIEKTQGNDIGHLMSALASQKRLWMRQAPTPSWHCPHCAPPLYLVPPPGALL